MRFFSGDAATPISFRRWNQNDLRALQILNRDCSRVLHDATALDITRKLRGETASTPEASRDSGPE
jgi:hypothetical protein